MPENKDKKTKILYLITKSNWGGAQKYVFDLADEAKKNNYDVVVATGGTGGKNAPTGQLVQELSRIGIRTVPLRHLTRDMFWLREVLGFWDIFKVIADEDPDIIHLNSSKAAGIGAFWSRLIGMKKIIYTVHGWPFNETRSFFAKIIIGFFSWLTAILSTDVIVISKADMKKASQMPLVRKKTRLIYNGIPVSNSLPRPEARLKIKQETKIDLKQSEMIIGTIAELHPNKNLDLLIESASLSETDWKVVIVGEGESRQYLERKIKNLHLENRVFLAGFINNASSILRAFDIFVLPSKKEGLPYVILEAGRAELPTIATNVGGVPEIIESGHTGILLAQADPKTLAQAIDKLITNTDQKLKLGRNLNQKVVAEFSRLEMIEKTFLIYNK